MVEVLVRAVTSPFFLETVKTAHAFNSLKSFAIEFVSVSTEIATKRLTTSEI